MRATCVVLLSVLVLWCGATAFAAEDATAKGVVFDDANGNGVRDRSEAGIADVRVSNGREIVLTDETGRYELPVGDDTIVFVIKPRGWMTPVDGLNLPRFYYVHKPAGSPKLEYAGVEPTGPLPNSIDFPLVKHDEPDRFSIIVFGDTQTRSVANVDFLQHDIIEEVVGYLAVAGGQEAAGAQKASGVPSASVPVPAFGISLGDIVYDLLEVFDPINRAVAQVGVPFYNVLGNHDTNQDTGKDRYSDETWERVYGPSYYSFDYGPVHFIHLDSVAWYWHEEENEGRYRAGLGERQLEFVKNDLALLPKDQLVVLSMHIPVMELAERDELFAALAEHPHALAFAAHWHNQHHFFLDKDDGWPGAEPLHAIVFGTACGYWWHGEKDEAGIPHATQSDGTPNGWWTVTFDGAEYSIRFKAARRPADYQMNVYAPEEALAADTAKTEVLANVFAGSEKSVVKMRVGKGAWVDMQRVTDRPDPAIERLEYAAGGTSHMWLATLPENLKPGTHMVEVRTTDMFGHTYTGRRIIRVK